MRIVLVLALAFLFVVPVQADSIQYTFSTTSGVNGSFTFEDSTPFNIGTGFFQSWYYPPEPMVSARSGASPTSGAFGDYSFSGTGWISRQDLLPPYDGSLDHGENDYWILRTTLSGQMVLGKALTQLSLFDYASVFTDMGPLVAPPTSCANNHGQGNCGLSYYVGFSDGTSESGTLASLAMVQGLTVTQSPVPEPSSLALLPLGLIGLVLVRRRVTSAITITGETVIK